MGFAVRAGGAEVAQWTTHLRESAERILRHELDFFNLRGKHLGNPIDWNRDHERDQPAPRGFAPAIDYRDVRTAGDAKVVWEPNRHHHLVVLARAYRATGDTRYAEGVAEQLDSWLAQCPFGTGMNWRSPLELGIRLINWTWALDLILESDAVPPALECRLVDAMYQLAWETRRKYSRGSSANNHLIGEAAGVFVAANYLKELPEASAWLEESRAILEREIISQTYDDGSSREHAFGYHVFVAQFFLFCGYVARRTAADFSREYWARLGRMLDFVHALTEAGGLPPMFGDADDGYVLDLGGSDRPRDLLAMAAAMGICTAEDGGAVEPGVWLSDAEPLRDEPPVPEHGAALRSRAFADAGYYLLQSDGPEQLSVFIDCAPLGFGPLAAHGHADALSICVRAFGKDVLIDPGTYDYFSHREWRDYFRSTRAHNTLVLEGENQSEMLGLFLWGRRATARCLSWHPSADGGRFVGEHDGYMSLPAPAVHRRSIQLQGTTREVVVRDEVIGEGEHEVQLCFHVAPGCGVTGVQEHGVTLSVADLGEILLGLPETLSVRLYEGSESPRLGWYSPGYHQKVPCTTIVATGRITAPAVLEWRLMATCRTGRGQVESAAFAGRDRVAALQG